jgi:hypothetical protein
MVEYYPKEKAEEEFMALTGTQLKLAGMGRAAKKHADDLEYVRSIARYLSSHGEIISIEDVRAFIEAGGVSWTLGNASGSVFDGGEWEWCGFTRAKRREAHARMIRTWRIKT